MKIMRDRAKTRIKTDAVTSYSSDKDINYASNSSVDTLILSIGSAVIKLSYHKLEDREADVLDLDKIYTCGPSSTADTTST